ncbi:MAG TPA: tetratricopeptide repeat protein [Xanthobacteraceae bacterium]|nr:tetratricopeptide repeat protein [Xanthobacteraceae bacterium]
MKTNQQTAALFAAAVQQHQAGALREAEQTYRRVLALDPTHVDALHYLGVLAHQAGRNDIAVDLIGRAISLNEKNPECHYNIGIAFGALGRFDEAAEANKKAIRLKPDYAEAYMNLGNAAKAKNNLDEAKANYEKALGLKPQLAAARFNLANVLSDEGKHEEAISNYEKALALRPNYAEALTNLGTALLALGRTDEAEERHRAAIALNPRLSQAYGNLGDLFLKQKKYDEAIEWYGKALALNPDYAEVHNNLGMALLAQGKNDEALVHCEKAFALKPKLPQAFHNFGKALVAKGEIGKALEIIRHAHEIEETAETRSLFATYLGDPRSLPYAGRYRDILIRAISEGWGDPRGTLASQGLVHTCLAVVETNPALIESLDRAMQAWPSRLPARELFGADGLTEIAKDELFRRLLSYERLNGIELEKFLSALRAALLEMAAKSDGAPFREALALFCALAQQCFNNEYVYFAPEHEWQAASAVRDNLAQALSRGETLSPLQVAAIAAYFPLHELANADALLEAGLPEEVGPLLRQQILEPKEELEYRASMPRLTPIEDAVSQQVRAQYEENPYPRWVKTISPQARRMQNNEFMRLKFPRARYQELSGEIDYLIAGCGTGQQVAMIKTFLDIDRMLAIDLSFASLAFAKRMANKLGLTGVEFAQADILQLPSLGRTFNVVDSAGVLHHLADPEAGWRALELILRPGGIMRIGLYSELARKMVVEARETIAAEGYGQSADDIRRFRQGILAMDKDASIRKVVRFTDFFSLSECRDLLFHVQEHRFTVPRIARFLNENDLVFLGFDILPEVVERYSKQFPDDEAATNLEYWDKFEHENPDTFVQMYQFWVQKPAAEKKAHIQ